MSDDRDNIAIMIDALQAIRAASGEVAIREMAGKALADAGDAATKKVEHLWHCNICGGEVDHSNSTKATVHVGPGRR